MQQRLYWLDYDPVALAVLVIGMGMIGVLVLSGGGVSCGRDMIWAALSITEHKDRRRRCQAAPDLSSNDNGAGTPPQLSPSGGVFPSAAQSGSLT